MTICVCYVAPGCGCSGRSARLLDLAAPIQLITHTHAHTLTQEQHTLVDTECCETVNKQIKHSLARRGIDGVKLLIQRNDAADQRDLSFTGSFI